MTLFWLTAGTLLVNIPFGWLRYGTRKFSLAWLLCVHAPIPLVVTARLALGIGYTIIPLLVAASVAGQIVGGKLRSFARTFAGPATEETD